MNICLSYLGVALWLWLCFSAFARRRSSCIAVLGRRANVFSAHENVALSTAALALSQDKHPLHSSECPQYPYREKLTASYFTCSRTVPQLLLQSSASVGRSDPRLVDSSCAVASIWRPEEHEYKPTTAQPQHNHSPAPSRMAIKSHTHRSLRCTHAAHAAHRASLCCKKIFSQLQQNSVKLLQEKLENSVWNFNRLPNCALNRCTFSH